MNYSKWIIICAHVPVLAAAAYAVFLYKQLTPALKIFCWFIFLSAVIQVISLAMWLNGKNNMPLLHAYVLLGFLCLALFYRKVLYHFINPAIITVIAILFPCYTIINSAVIQKTGTFNSYALTVESVLVVILSLFTYMVLLNDAVKEKRKEQVAGLHWINSGLFIYYAPNMLLVYFGRVIINEFSAQINQYTWMLHAFFSTVMYICFITGLWKQTRTSAS